jgi:hypothetical protein
MPIRGSSDQKPRCVKPMAPRTDPTKKPAMIGASAAILREAAALEWLSEARKVAISHWATSMAS